MLSFSYDLRRLAAAMKRKRAYEVSAHPRGLRVIISRTFNGVKYNIIFEDRDSLSFNLNTYNFEGYPSGMTDGGEECDTPADLIKGKVYRMIEDLPLNARQKAELKGYVVVTQVVEGTLF